MRNFRISAFKLTLLKKILNLRLRLPFVVLMVILSFLIGRFLTGDLFVTSNVSKTTLNGYHSDNNVNISVTQAHLTDTIRFSQKSSKAPEGKDFLVIFTDVGNASSSAMQVVYGNWFRIDENGKKLAPLPLNSQFTIPPQANLEKQVVFLVEKGKNNFNLLLGDIEKVQQLIEVKF